MKNLLYNADFELWTLQNESPEGWSLGGVGSRHILRETTDVYSSYYGARTWTGESSGNYTTLAQMVHSATGAAYWRGRYITFGAWAKTDVYPNLRLYIYDGIAASTSSYHPGDNEWHFLKVTRLINNSATMVQLYPTFYNNANSSTVGYYDNLVALEGCWVPQTPYDFEDVEFRLGPSSSTSVVLYPEEGMELGKYLMHNTQRAADGHLYGYEFGTYHKSSFPVEYMPASDAAIVNSWWESQAKLLLFVTSGPVTAVYSCMIMGDNCPMCQVSKPYDDRFKGTIQLEGY